MITKAAEAFRRSCPEQGERSSQDYVIRPDQKELDRVAEGNAFAR